MRQSSATERLADGQVMGGGLDEADGYIELLVHEIVHAAGATGLRPPVEADGGIDVVQAQLERLRNAESEQTGTGTGSLQSEVVGLPSEEPAVKVHRVPEVHVDVREAQQIQSASSTRGQRLGQVLPEAGRKSGVSPLTDAEAVILEAMSVTGPIERSEGVELRLGRAARPEARSKVLKALIAVLFAALLLALGGGAVIVGQYLLSKTDQNLFESYWIENDTQLTGVSETSNLGQDYRNPSSVHDFSSLPEVVPEIATVQRSAEILKPSDGLTFTRRTVKTFRVGADGKILFAPRAGS